MRRTLSILMALAITLTLALAGCGSTPPPADSPADSGSSPAPAGEWAPVTPGVLTVGTSADFAPYEFHILKDGQDKIVGFDMSLAQYIADDWGLELKIVDMSFDSILIELENGTIDLAIAGLSPDPERDIFFSSAYYTGNQCMMVKKENLEKYKGYADFDSADFSVGAQTGSIQADLAAEHTPNANQVLLQAIPNIIMELKAGTIDAAYMETLVAEGYTKTQDDLAVLCEVPYEAEGSCVGVKKGSQATLDKVNATLQKLAAEDLMGGWVAEANDLSGQAVG